MSKIGRSIVRQKKILRELMAMDQKAWEAVEKVMVVSCLKLPNKGLGRREMLLGFAVLKMKVGW